MRASSDRSLRFVFHDVADAYMAGRLDLPIEAVRWGLEAAGVPAGGRVLEIGAGGGQLTVALLEAGLDVVALEPGAALRERAERRADAASFVASTFEDYGADGRFDAVVSANAFHWVDPAVAHAKAADLADALVLLWNSPFPADAELFRRVQNDVMGPRDSTFPDDETGVRALIDHDSEIGRAELRASGRFAEPQWRLFERRLEVDPGRYVSLLSSLGNMASRPEATRRELREALLALLGDEPFELLDLVYVVVARALPD